MPAITYEVFDDDTGKRIGTITGAELRTFMNVSARSTVFNPELIRQFNDKKRSLGEPERIRQMLRR
jgi:hypothetical protein